MSIPQELLDLIVHYIPNDADLDNTLRVCTYTFRGLAGPARLRLLRSLQLTPIVTNGGIHMANKCQRLLKLLDSPRNMGALIHALHIVESPSDELPWIVKASRTLSLILPSLVNLRHFYLRSKLQTLQWELFSRSFKAAIEKIASQLDTLSLRGVFIKLTDTAHRQQILAIIAKSPKLTRVVLCFREPWYYEEAEFPLLPERQAGGGLESLVVGGRSMPTQVVFGPLDLTFLRVLAVQSHSESLTPLVQVCARAKMLEELYMWPGTQYGLQLGSIGLSAFPRLRVLHICDRWEPPSLRQVVEECCTIPTLQHVSFEFRMYVSSIPRPSMSADQIDAWNALGAAVTARPSTLEDVRVTIPVLYAQDKLWADDFLAQHAMGDFIAIRVRAYENPRDDPNWWG
ncbi:hypothetical protein MIND_00132000 [Mycena indigotica]|uniref:Uncharacterized protein n=1 Tax=Mycena indigotica TaxID=2126181 RepID=A0A8H6WEW7_9AGAR|nr:uncharacterized protein MIND_00132000 [Mycena indigotica]KAF7316139.1 hypothetical protein MIND_00132000 [Mycena indigotica]